MKILTILFFLIFTFSGKAQNYLDLTTEWEESSSVCGNLGTCSTSDFTIKLTGDTIINNVTYFKTKREGITTVWDFIIDSIVSVTAFDNDLFPLREEDGIFYIYHTSQNEEQVLHDFNLSVGDTAVTFSSCSVPQIVVQIDTVYFGSQMRKKFIFFPDLTFGSSPLYEGIGSSRGLFVKPCSGQIGIEFGSSLYCYSHLGETIQIDTLGSCETTMIITNAVTPKEEEIEVRPNPFDDQIIIENPFTLSNQTAIQLYDLNGKLLKSDAIIKGDDNFIIPTRDLLPGIYFLIINTNGEIRSRKLVKI